MNDKNKKSPNDPEVTLLYCQHAIHDEAKGSDWSQHASGVTVHAAMLPCSSKIEVPYILKILESGVDAVEIVACPEKNCKFLIGSCRAEKRIEYIRRLLEEIGYEPQRVGITKKLSQSPEKLIQIARDRADEVRSFEINPMKKGEHK